MTPSVGKKSKPPRIPRGAGGGAGSSPRKPARRNPRRDVLRFVLIVGTSMVLFNVLFYVRLSEDSVLGSYLALNARLSAGFVNLFGDQATVTGTAIRSARGSLEVRPGCDGIQASAFFIFAVLASPAPLSLLARIPSILAGMLLLLTINLVRIISLYYTQIYFPSAFEVMHVEVWQAVFIFLPIVFWVVWLRWAQRGRGRKADVAK